MHLLPSAPDTIIHNAAVYTVEPDYPWASAVALRGGVIIAVGQSDEILALAGPSTRKVDALGRLVLPGLCDAHIHFLSWSLAQSQVNLASTRSKAEMLSRIAERAKQSAPDTWILGQGWNESWWGETEFPTAADLEIVTAGDLLAFGYACSRGQLPGARSGRNHRPDARPPGRSD